MSEIKHSVPSKPPTYRWVVLLVFALNGLLSQIFWLNFASINSLVAQHYGVTTTQVDLLSLMFMVVYLVVGPFSSLLIDARGFRVGASVGVILTAGFGFLRFFAGATTSFTLLIIFQIGVAAGQPFLYNSISKLAARWFPPEERATASGLTNLGFFVGMLVGFILPPILYPLGMSTMLLILGIVGLGIATLFLIYGKDHPEIPYGDTTPIPLKQVLKDLGKLLRMRFAVSLAVVAFLALGSFNTIATLIQYITGIPNVSPDDSGTLGGILILAGIIGLIIIPAISDKWYKAKKAYARKLFVILGNVIAIPVSILVAVTTDFVTVLILMGILGFFVLPSFAIALQWIVEQTVPIQESESNNLLMYAGQISGILFIFMVPALFNTPIGSTPMYSSAMFFFAILDVISVLLLVLIKETKRKAD